MKNCCRHTKNNQKCKRRDGKLFDLPRKFSKKKCMNSKIKGFTMRSSCAPYKYCQKGGNRKRKKSRKPKNILGGKLKTCSLNPKTGWLRNGYCMKKKEDGGAHTVCALMDDNFLEYTKSKGNNLYGVVSPGDKWCICENRYLQSFLDGKAPKIIKKASTNKINKKIKKIILENN